MIKDWDLTLSSLLLTLVGHFLGGRLTPAPAWVRVTLLLGVLVLLNSIVLLVAYLEVGRETTISLDQADAKLSADDLRKILINRYLGCEMAANDRTDYLVDVYKAARVYFMTAMTIVVFTAAIHLLWQYEDSDPRP